LRFWILTFVGMTSLLAIPAFAVTISPAIPGMTSAVTTSTSPGAFVSGFYQFALMIGGVLAFGAIVYGGILYAASAGNPGKQSEGREWITSALLGLLLLAGAYLILYTINPNLVNLNLPSLQAVSVAGTSQGACSSMSCPTGSSPVNVAGACDCQDGAGTVYCGGSNNGQCPSGQTCSQTQSFPAVWACVSSASFTCGVPPSRIGTCPGGEACKQTGFGAEQTYECEF